MFKENHFLSKINLSLVFNRKNTVAFFLFFGMIVFSQNLKSDSIVMQKIINKYFSKIEDERLAVVKDKLEVDLIKCYILKKNEIDKLERKKLKEKEESTVGKRYRNGDKTTIPQIIKILKSKNRDEIYDLLKDLELDYLSKEEELVLEIEIIDCLKNLLSDEELEHIIVQFLGYNKVNNAEAILEERLLSGMSSDNDRIFYWLGSNYNNANAVDFVYKSYFSNKINLEKEYWILNGFEYYLKNDSEVNKAKIIAIAYDYLNKNPITKSNFKTDNHDYLHDGMPLNFTFFHILLFYDYDNSYKILDDILKNLEGSVEYEDYKNQISQYRIKSYSKEDRKINFLKKLEHVDAFFEILDVLKNDSDLYEDEELNKVIFENFEKIVVKKQNEFKYIDSFDTNILINYLENQKKEFVLKNIDHHIKQNDLKSYLTKIYLVSKMNYKDISDFLLSNHIIDSAITELEVENYKSNVYYADNINTIEACLDLKGIAYNFDVEVGIIPVEYDYLLDNFCRISKNKIKNIHSYVQHKLVKKTNTLFYQFLVAYNDKCYIMKPEDQGDWYDMETFMKLINQITKDTNCKEEFISIETGGQDAYYIFGEKEKVELIRNTFYPEFSIN